MTLIDRLLSSLPDRASCLVAADALLEAGRDQEATILRHGVHRVISGGQVFEIRVSFNGSIVCFHQMKPFRMYNGLVGWVSAHSFQIRRRSRILWRMGVRMRICFQNERIYTTLSHETARFLRNLRP